MTSQYNHNDFLPLSVLAGKKTAKGIRISLVIPSLNEAGTVGNVVACARERLMEQSVLLDEIVVMDGGSVDGTPEIARKAGATVYNVRDVCPCRDIVDGKGTSLWASQFVVSGDIIIFIDADIMDFQERFIYGLAGPFFDNEDVWYAKAYYRRPFMVSAKKILQDQGGRVTEIFLRPFLCAFFPELAGIYQPLSGEYAFKKDVLVHMPFSSGYSVELVLLFEFYRRHGLSHMAQVDMGTRYHRNRTVKELGKMSFGILNGFWQAWQKNGGGGCPLKIADIMHSYTGGCWETTQIKEILLPAVSSFRDGAVSTNRVDD